MADVDVPSSVSKVTLGSDTIWQNSDGWVPLKLGPEVVGNVFGKIDKVQRCIYLSGTVSIHPTKGGNFQIIIERIPGISFAINQVELNSIDKYATNGIGLWVIGLNSSGAIISNMSVPEDEIAGRLATIVMAEYSRGYPNTATNWTITDNEPLKIPITFD